MSFDVLYFPNLSLPGPAWTNSVSLYFDRIGIIAPSEYEVGLSDPHTAAYVAQGIVKPMFGGAHDDHPEDEDLVEAIARWWYDREMKMLRLPRMYQIHRGKIESAGLLRLLTRHNLLRPDQMDKKWLVGPGPVCMRIMAILAQRIAERQSISAVLTNQRNAFEFVTSKKVSIEPDLDRRIRAVTSLLPVGPAVTAEQVARFKADHQKELRQFRGFVEQLIRRDKDDESFEARLRDANDLRNQLIGELKAIDGRTKMSVFGLMVARFSASMAEFAPFSGIIDLVTGVRSRSLDANRRREIGRDGLAYAAMARLDMRARSSKSLLA